MSKINSLLENSINNIIKNYSSFFFNKKNVNGVGLGYKVINGINTYEPVLHVLVKKKISPNQLYAHDIIPKNFIGIKTDVIQIGEPSINSSNDNKTSNIITPFPEENSLLIQKLNSNSRPIQAGCAISPLKKNWNGTLGCIVFNDFTNEPYLLSNNHVIADNNLIPKNWSIFSPNFSSYPYKKNMIARFNETLTLDAMKSSEDKSDYNTVDAAIAKLLPKVKYTKEIYNIGSIDGTTDAKLNETVYKVGATTGYTKGFIQSINCQIKVNMDNVYYFYENQIICSNLSEPGDSGSLVFNKDRKAVGLLMSGSENSTTINPIEEVFYYFNVHF